MAELSPMMRQYYEIKQQHEDCILFYRVGDFYEMFFDDAEKASQELDLVLTGKECGLEKRAPMCGVPFHSCDNYIARLVSKGYKVAICEQTEDPAKAKGLVRRDVVRIITPGTVIEDTMLDESKNNYLAALSLKNGVAGLCFTDASTGEGNITEISGDDLETRVCDEIMRFSPSELLVDNSVDSNPKLSLFLKESFMGTLTVTTKENFDISATEQLLLKHFSVISVENLGINSGSAAQSALGAVIKYLYETGVNGSISVNHVNVYNDAQYMRLEMTAVRNLELCETMRSKSKKGSLLWVLDKTKTAMGKRLIRAWVEQPLLSINEIILRQNALEELCSNTILRCEAVEYMNGIRDIERLMTRIVYGSASARELVTLADTARKFSPIKALLDQSSSRMIKIIHDDIDPLEEIVSLIDRAIDDQPPTTVREGGMIRKGYNEQVDQLRLDMNNGTGYLTDIENRERERTGIKNLRVRYNKVFGYYIEVTNSFLDKVPEDYIRKQTLTNCERFITDELKKLEMRVLTAKDRVVQLEYELFDEVRKAAAAQILRFQKTAGAIARLDVLCSLSQVAVDNNYCRPLIDNSGIINIKGGRHPVVEQVIKSPFVSNDTVLDNSDNRCAIITGPNMAGKSTYMRQVALITLMAQIGSFVPAQMAQIGIVDAIFTRVGASDDLASGQSTFMVEMSEVADILKNATKNSLLILDEIGRGTSTYDGMSIARAVLEFVADKRKLGAKALFATHYHELTEMENELQGVKNYNIAVKKRGDDIIFLRRIVPGGADDSYGIEVAKLSGIPDSVIKRAKAILKQTIEEGVVTYKTVASSDAQLPIEIQGATEILRELQMIDVNTLTPIEAMGILFDLANKAKSI
ncbi:MAG: DNA mismatch repair protein MutS [Ruminococcaceae bacterium]|nr:DNA mismatch repair protein MutS [Oscillospiraceae bacterium]